MATSSGDDLPRNIDFLFSRNRMNVAISRARCLAVIYANPRLLEVPCNTIEQMELVNGLCWARRFAGEKDQACGKVDVRSEEQTSELQSLMRISYAVFCLNKKEILCLVLN